jgi:hypothetical protein
VLEQDVDHLILGKTLRHAAESGLLGDDEDLVDSFMVAGAAARQGTYTLIQQAIRLVRRQLLQEGLPCPVLRRDDYDAGRKPAIAWQVPKARHDLLQDLVADARTLASFVQRVKEPTDALKQRALLLQTVTEQDIEALPDGSV